MLKLKDYIGSIILLLLFIVDVYCLVHLACLLNGLYVVLLFFLYYWQHCTQPQATAFKLLRGDFEVFAPHG